VAGLRCEIRRLIGRLGVGVVVPRGGAASWLTWWLGPLQVGSASFRGRVWANGGAAFGGPRGPPAWWSECWRARLRGDWRFTWRKVIVPHSWEGGLGVVVFVDKGAWGGVWLLFWGAPEYGALHIHPRIRIVFFLNWGHDRSKPYCFQLPTGLHVLIFRLSFINDRYISMESSKK
jgi:hypothetical protein